MRLTRLVSYDGNGTFTTPEPFPPLSPAPVTQHLWAPTAPASVFQMHSLGSTATTQGWMGLVIVFPGKWQKEQHCRHLKGPACSQMVIRAGKQDESARQETDLCVDGGVGEEMVRLWQEARCYKGDRGGRRFEISNHLDALCAIQHPSDGESLCRWLIGKYFR